MKRLLAIYAFLVLMMLMWGLGAQAQLGSNTRTIKADVIDSNTASLIEFLKDLKISSTGYVLLPKGTTAQRPGSPVAGMFRYNTTDNTFEGYTTEWGPIAGGGGLSEWQATEEYEADQTVFIKESNVFKIYAAKAAFNSGASFDVTNWNELSKSRIDDKQLLDDPGFEYGVSEWSCTNATVEQVTNTNTSNIDHGVGTGVSAAKITVTADGGYCEIVKTIGTSQAGTYVPSIYYASTSANAFIEFARDSRARVVDELDFINSGDYEFISAQLVASTGLSIRLGGNNTDVIHADMASMELGGYNRSASKNCSGVLDCDNVPTAYYDATEATATLRAKKQTPTDWAESIAKGNTNNFVKDVTVSTGTFSATPNCECTARDTSNGNCTYNEQASTATNLQFRTFDTTNTAVDASFTFSCTKAPVDYKTTEDQGVTIIPDNKDARLVVTNEGTTSNVTIGNGTITVPFDTVKPISKYIDFASNEATFQKGGEYELQVFITLDSGSSTSTNQVFVELNDGTGYSPLVGDDSKCGAFTSSVARLVPITCSFIFNLEKGDKVRVRASGTNVDAVVVQQVDRYSRMIITPLGGGKAVVENQGVPTYEGEGGMIAGYASFGGATDGSDCSTSPCTRYREVGSLAGNMSATRASTGLYTVTVTGFKPSSNIYCNVTGGTSGDFYYATLRPSEFVADASGEAVFNVRIRTGTINSDAYFQVKCEGPRP